MMSSKDPSGPHQTSVNSRKFIEKRIVALRAELQRAHIRDRPNLKCAIQLWENGTLPGPLNQIFYIQGGKVVQVRKSDCKVKGEITLPSATDRTPQPIRIEGRCNAYHTGPPPNIPYRSCLPGGSSSRGNAGRGSARGDQTERASSGLSAMVASPKTTRGMVDGHHWLALEIRMVPAFIIQTPSNAHLIGRVIRKPIMYDTGSGVLSLTRADFAELGWSLYDAHGNKKMYYDYIGWGGDMVIGTANGDILAPSIQLECRLLEENVNGARTITDWVKEVCIENHMRLSGAKIRQNAYFVTSPRSTELFVSKLKTPAIEWLSSR